MPGGATGAATITRAAPWARATSARGAHRRAGRDAVVDDERRPAGERHAVARPAEPRGAARELEPLARLDRGEVGRGHAGASHDLLVDDPHAVLADRAHRQLGLERHAELADDDHVERGAERGRDLERDRHSAAREPEHDQVLPR